MSIKWNISFSVFFILFYFFFSVSSPISIYFYSAMSAWDASRGRHMCILFGLLYCVAHKFSQCRCFDLTAVWKVTEWNDIHPPTSIAHPPIGGHRMHCPLADNFICINFKLPGYTMLSMFLWNILCNYAWNSGRSRAPARQGSSKCFDYYRLTRIVGQSLASHVEVSSTQSFDMFSLQIIRLWILVRT